MNKNIECILFDLDGTFADTSKDMCDALNTILTEKKFTNVNCKELKLHISRGAVGIIDYASKVNGRSIDSSLMRAEFLQEYSNKIYDTQLTYSSKESKRARPVVENLKIYTIAFVRYVTESDNIIYLGIILIIISIILYFVSIINSKDE